MKSSINRPEIKAVALVKVYLLLTLNSDSQTRSEYPGLIRAGNSSFTFHSVEN